MFVVGRFCCSCVIQRFCSITAVLCLIVLLTAKPAYAYLDPGTGSMILQLLLGGVAGALMVGKLYYRKIQSFVAGLRGHPIEDENREDEA